MGATERTFESWAKERHNKDSKNKEFSVYKADLYKELICRINIFTGKERWLEEQDNNDGKDKKSNAKKVDLYKEPISRINIFTGEYSYDDFAEEKIVLSAEFEDWIEESYNHDKKNEKPYEELDEIKKDIYRCDFLDRFFKENDISTDGYYFVIDGMPVAELKRQDKEIDLEEERKDLVQNCINKMIKIEELEDRVEEYYNHDKENKKPYAGLGNKEKNNFRCKCVDKLLEENKINDILKDGYKSDDIKAQEKIAKDLKKCINRIKDINNRIEKINEERAFFLFGKEKRFENLPDCAIELFDWLLDNINRDKNRRDKANEDGTYSIYLLKKDMWEILDTDDKNKLLRLLPKIKEYPDLELSDEDIQNIELKLNRPYVYRLRKNLSKIQDWVEGIEYECQEEYGKYLSILDKTNDSIYKAWKEVEKWEKKVPREYNIQDRLNEFITEILEKDIK